MGSDFSLGGVHRSRHRGAIFGRGRARPRIGGDAAREGRRRVCGIRVKARESENQQLCGCAAPAGADRAFFAEGHCGQKARMALAAVALALQEIGTSGLEASALFGGEAGDP